LIASMIPEGTAPPLGAVWLDTRIDLPGPTRSAYDRAYRDVFTNAVVEPVSVDGGLAIPAATIFDGFPVALLLPCSRLTSVS
jgi:hypothetical protein